ncbi:MAG: SURF1 family cytochrome oxidase biogenesis protein [Rhodoluna sp.]
MSDKAPTFFRVATRPKWIGALLLSLLVAAIFAGLGQWQLDRAFTKDEPKTNSSDSSLALVEKKVMLDVKNVYIVDGRMQNGVTGYWLLMNSKDENLVSTTIAVGWVEKLADAERLRNGFKGLYQAEAFLPISGYPLPSEAPQPADSGKPYLLHSVSLGQLINLYSPDQPIKSSPEYLALSAQSVQFSDKALQPIQVTYRDGEKINWLSAFYFLEWMLFAGFAVFLWWRLVMDEIIRLKAEAQLDKGKLEQ